MAALVSKSLGLMEQVSFLPGIVTGKREPWEAPSSVSVWKQEAQGSAAPGRAPQELGGAGIL